MGDKSSDSKDEAKLIADIKERIKKQLRQELLEEIYQELKREEKEPLNTKKSESEIIDLMKQTPGKNAIPIPNPPKEIETVPTPVAKPNNVETLKEAAKSKDITYISTRTILKIASHAFKYANKNIPKDKWVEVIGLLAGKVENDVLSIEDAFPMGHGNAIHAEVKDYKNFSRAFTDIRKQEYFICGWYHSHPTYGLFLSTEDLGTQTRYQKLWDKSIALVMDPYMIDGTSYGFETFRTEGRKYFPVPFKLKGAFTPQELPELLAFINPIVDGKALYLEYDEE